MLESGASLTSQISPALFGRPVICVGFAVGWRDHVTYATVAVSTLQKWHGGLCRSIVGSGDADWKRGDGVRSLAIQYASPRPPPSKLQARDPGVHSPFRSATEVAFLGGSEAACCDRSLFRLRALAGREDLFQELWKRSTVLAFVFGVGLSATVRLMPRNVSARLWKLVSEGTYVEHAVLLRVLVLLKGTGNPQKPYGDRSCAAAWGAAMSCCVAQEPQPTAEDLISPVALNVKRPAVAILRCVAFTLEVEQKSEAHVEQEPKAQVEQKSEAQVEQEPKAQVEQETKAQVMQERKAQVEQKSEAQVEQKSEAKEKDTVTVPATTDRSLLI
ncbi:hypothetical protein BESB_000850 [Besnoitia besnoiti]|uniref:Uncharacterized protein n=1 Tax=Besnoitia besnoiti TaxID=94643 RepID=A0A2A9MP12_BESBE|nr:hypothetical protein BESB_000850 [Besnoitia besnoiti]PFH37743.1 hypothetical protein BESB_000850 [Besnoitia besnoiti]